MDHPMFDHKNTIKKGYFMDLVTVLHGGIWPVKGSGVNGPGLGARVCKVLRVGGGGGHRQRLIDNYIMGEPLRRILAKGAC